jgi:XTP/dITP diphosphohydrolase
VVRFTGCWALADDSGLSVEALGGTPGAHSTRYTETDAARIDRLLQELTAAAAQTPEARWAHFTAALALANPQGEVVLEVEGICPGTILEAPRGEGGFGYDPVFFVPEAGLTFAEMPHSQKAELGHRGRAFSALKPRLPALVNAAGTPK